MTPISRITVIGAVAILAMVIIGQFCMHMDVRTECTLNHSDDGISFEIDLGYVSNYSVVSFDDGGIGRNQKFVACFDYEHVWYKSNYYIENTLQHLENDMAERGLDLMVIETDSVVKIMNSEIDNAMSDTTIIFMTGSFPEEIWNGSDESTIVKWLEIGGNLVWGSGPMGFNISTDKECVKLDVDPGLVFYNVNGAVNNSEGRTYDNTLYPEGIADLFRIYFSETTWGIMSGVSDDQLVTEYNIDGYAAVSVTKYYNGSGSIVVFGGDVDNNLTGYVAQFLASGLGYCSEIVDYEIGIGKHASGTLESSDSNAVAFLTLGLMSDNIVQYIDCDSDESVERSHRFGETFTELDSHVNRVMRYFRIVFCICKEPICLDSQILIVHALHRCGSDFRRYVCILQTQYGRTAKIGLEGHHPYALMERCVE